MMYAKDFREVAWQKKQGKWGKLALITLVYSLLMGICSGLTQIGIGGIITFLVSGPFTLSWAIISLNVVRDKDFSMGTLFDGFHEFGKSFVLWLLIDIFTFLWSLLLIIPGIIKAYSYSMSYFVLQDNPELSANEARKKSMELMQGNKWRLFCLHFSFIGWILLSVLTFGILLFWVIPYMQAADAAFYEEIKR